MLRSSLCDYSDAYMLVKRNITVNNTTAAAVNNTNKKVIFKNCTPFTNFEILEYKNIIKVNLNLMKFFLEIIYFFQ